jgi:hypothetical protein
MSGTFTGFGEITGKTGLPGGKNQAHNFARLYGKRNIINSLLAAVYFGEVLY